MPEKTEQPEDDEKLEKIGRRPSHLSENTKKRLEELEQDQLLDTDLKSTLLFSHCLI